jgi:hypothetical protein
MPNRHLLAVVVLLTSLGAEIRGADRAPTEPSATAQAAQPTQLSADETRALMRRLAEYVVEHHLKRDDSPQRGMTYEYYRPASAGKPDQYVQGEALDTMHDGCWFAIAMANAYRATGDGYYKDVLTKWQLPFYLKMLNQGDELFSADPVHVRPEARDTWKTSKEWLLQGREKGFVPYFWDDGSSVSLEMRNTKRAELSFPGFDQFTADGKPNPDYRLSGYSHGSSNHLAQDLAVMLQTAWLLLRESDDPADKKLAEEVALGAKHLYECRLRHHGHIPAVDACWGLISGDRKILNGATDGASDQWWTPKNHYTAALRDFKPGARVTTPGFADDQQYFYYASIARAGGGTLPEPMAFKLTYDAYTHPILYRMYCDDEPPSPGMNRFDLHPYHFVDGKPADFRSEKKGPGGEPRPTGSRMGPQNMVVCGWALQALKHHPGLWEKPYREKLSADKNLTPEAEVTSWLEHELGAGLGTWRAIFDRYGYIPTGIGAGSMGAGFAWEEYSDTGGYAHLISAGAQWLLYLDGKRDWELQNVPIVK